MQKTLTSPVEFNGVGLHSGVNTLLRVLPAVPNSGVVFERVDVHGIANRIPAQFQNVCDATLNTRIVNADGVYVSTIEHLMAAFAGLGITNALVQVNNQEIPILDGSSAHFVNAFTKVGISNQNVPSHIFRVVAPVRVTNDQGAYAELLPDNHFHIDYTIQFDDAAIGDQYLSLAFENGVFGRELADCRTFALHADVKRMHTVGLGLGGSLENAVIVDNGAVLNAGGFRRDDECVRHKILDAIGDLALLGAPIIGRYVGYKAGHALTNALLRKAQSQNAIKREIVTSAIENILPGYCSVPIGTAKTNNPFHK